jgi:shikimate kinase
VKADKLYLVGFMGAGKTTVARQLAKRLDWKTEDIDERIEKRERRDIPAIFRRDGEPYFRAIEREELIALRGRDLARRAACDAAHSRAARRPPAAGDRPVGDGTAL